MRRMWRTTMLVLTLLASAPGAPAQEATAGAAPGPAPLLDVDLESLSATRTMPLFTPSRSVPPPAEPAPVYVPEPVVVYQPPPAPPALQLLGIFAAQTDQVAVLSDPAQGSVLRLRSGDEHSGWVLRIVDGRTVEFARGDSRHTLRLFQDFGTTTQSSSVAPGELPFAGDPTPPPTARQPPSSTSAATTGDLPFAGTPDALDTLPAPSAPKTPPVAAGELPFAGTPDAPDTLPAPSAPATAGELPFAAPPTAAGEPEL